jgi:adenine-specific DNA methylase
MEEEIARFFFYPPEPQQNCVPDGYLWSRTITCPYCNGLVPLSPNWRLDGKGKGVRLVPHTENPNHRHCTFEIVEKLKEQSAGTVKGGDGQCPYPDCGRGIHGDEIKAQAQAGKMGQQLYAIVYKETKIVGYTKTGKPKVKKIRGFRAPRPEDDVEEQVRKALEAKMPEWQARNIVPDEEYPANTNDDRPRQYGMPLWRDMFAPRQLYGHCVSVEVFQDMVEELRQKNGGELSELDKAAMAYIAIAIDKMLNYNSRMSVWMPTREVVANTFNRHDFAFCWSFAEMAPTITGLGYDWALRSGEEALEELIKLLNGGASFQLLDETEQSNGAIRIRLGSADALDLENESVDCIVMDPPYYDNVMYAELADFFYVWLKRTAGLLYPEAFVDYLTDKDREAVANPAKFKGKRKAKDLAGEDYQRRMAAIFKECRRVLKPHGVMTLMFTHKASGAWDAVARGLVEAGFVITASWPVNTEAEGSMHIREKSAAKSTIFLVCRVRETRPEDSDTVYWEDIEPKVAEAVRRRIAEFQNAGIRGVDLYLASFGPALQVFSEAWPIKRGRAVQQPSGLLYEEFDAYGVRPEDALDAARREVKQWRMDQLATIKRQHHLDPVTEWFILAWDAFRAPRFPADEGLKLARVVGTDFDSDIRNRLCEVKGSDAILWDSSFRKRKGRLGPVGGAVMLDTLHQAAALGIEQNTGAAKELIDQAGLVDDATFLTALEALLNVLPPGGSMAKGKSEDVPVTGASNDFEALEKLRRLAFTEKVPAPQQAMLF